MRMVILMSGGPEGSTGQMSWRRLEDTLRVCGELKPHEVLVSFECTSDFLRLQVRTVPRKPSPAQSA